MVKSYSLHRKKYAGLYDALSWKWSKFLEEYWEKYPKECSICGTRRRVELHHIVPRHIAPDRIFDESNVIALCRSCHLRWGHLGDWDMWNPYIVDDAYRLSGLMRDRKRLFLEGGGHGGIYTSF